MTPLSRRTIDDMTLRTEGLDRITGWIQNPLCYDTYVCQFHGMGIIARASIIH